MPEKSDLQYLESECSTVDDWTDLALQALEEPADEDYAVELTGKAKMDCQVPEDYVNLAQFVAEYLLTDSDYLEDLLEQAKDVCFEPMEFAELGNAFTMLGNPDRGLALIYKAIETVDSDDKGDIVRLSHYAGEAGNGELAEVLEIEASFGYLDATDFQNLAKRVSSSNVEAAKCVAKRAEPYLNTIDDSVAYAKLIVQWYDDKDQARRVLENAAMDCEDFEDYIELVQGIREVLGEPERIDELLEKAAQIAMAGEEFADLAYAWLELKSDRGAALAIFRQAVPDISDRTVLQNIAITAASEFNNPELALQCYQKIADIITSPGDLVKLAVNCWETLECHQWGYYYTRDLFDAVKAKMANALDLATLAESVVQTLNDRDMVCAIYRDAVTACDSFSGLERILASQHAAFNDAELTLETLDRMKLLAADSAELVATFTAARFSSQDPEMCRSILVDAENAAASLADLESVIAAVREFAPDDQAWMSNLEDKLGSH